MIDRATADRIKDAADIVEVVSDYVHLTRRGSNFMGLCPFHNERTPSFSVNRRKNMCYCFSCHKGGSPVNFIMEKEGINYHDALLHLAKKYGITVEERELTDEERQLQSRREGMLVVNEWAMEKMENNLTATDEGRDIGLQYFLQRGITNEAIRKFHLGYAIDRQTALSDEAKAAGHDLEILKEVGLVGISGNGNMYDRFRGRVIFPIQNTAGKVVAFGGRDLKGGPAKYVNSPESDIYKKNRELYGIYQAKNEIVKQDKCFLVEGYMDVIGMWQAGMENAIASSGTALTDGQIALIHRFTENITLLYDGDAAGIKAALRGIDMLLSHKMRVKVLLLPDGHDPDSFARINTPEQFRKYVDEHETDIIRFKAQVLMNDAAGDPLKRSEAIRSVVESLACIPDPITANVYIQECSRLMDVDESIIATETRRMRAQILEKRRMERKYEQERDKLATDIKEHSSVAPDHRTGQQSGNTGSPSLMPYEKQLIRYCVRYGMMDFCEGMDESGNAVRLNVAEYVYVDLELENIRFSVPAFEKTFSVILGLKEQYEQDLLKFKAAQDVLFQQKREEGIKAISMKEMELSMIALEEERLDESLKAERLEEEKMFSAEYTSRTLASHEDDDVRILANQCANDVQPLSRRFDKIGNNIPEHDRLFDLIPRAITEWKQEITKLEINRLMELIRNAGSGDTELTAETMRQIASLQETMRDIAKSIGERVISPRR